MRRLALAGATALLALAAPSALGAAPVTLLPKGGCDVVKDPAGDASLAVEPSAAGLDITGLSFRLDSDTLTVVLRVPSLGSGMDRGTGDVWDVSFRARGREVLLETGRNLAGAPSPAAQENYFTTAELVGLDVRNYAAVDDNPVALTMSGEFSLARGFVSIAVDRVGLERLVGGSLDTLTELRADSLNRVGPVIGGVVDTAAGTPGQSVKLSDNVCFA